MPHKSNPHGDDQGTRVGSPDAPRRNDASGATGAGGEAAEGIHGASGDRDAAAKSSVDSQPTGRADKQTDSSAEERTGSEPLVDRQTEHRSGYGGSGGEPVSSSDQREGAARRQTKGTSGETSDADGQTAAS
jgi:hypothetical protein